MVAPEKATAAFWTNALSPFYGGDTKRSLIQLFWSAGPFFGLWTLAYWALDISYWLTLILSLGATGFLMRLFMIQHDCGHGSFFKSRRARNTLGFVIGVLTLIPYEYWLKTHAYHHAHSGDLDKRGFGDIDTLTLHEYFAKSKWGRLAYRVYRHPLILLGVGAVFHFVVFHRFPWNIPRNWKGAWRSVWLTNLALAVAITALALTIGLTDFLLVHGPIVFLTCAAGVWLFYVQHQFEDTYWHRTKNWNFFDAALQGSSYLVLPRPLQWLTANIGIHHVHHLSVGIPNYRLEEAMAAVPELQNPTRVTLPESARLMGLALWDEAEGRLVGFREAKRLVRSRSATNGPLGPVEA
jgi:omega-6 fatty acid desaturase (delta-12 desaturase)